ncbi:MAG: hypothetical protein PHC28_16300 [Flavobacterium sp.]|uniref:hypothetical protein n=1 Tax=Flavobacterium sp. TaxID=239 RepID=UPI002636B0AF|nr:hypothetical protein [Flavobacterium sp.]MDD5152015.1 hypothetical protein [Flavobacterium sp.]
MLARLERAKEILSNDKAMLYDSVLTFCETGVHSLEDEDLELLVGYIYEKEQLISLFEYYYHEVCGELLNDIESDEYFEDEDLDEE